MDVMTMSSPAIMCAMWIYHRRNCLSLHATLKSWSNHSFETAKADGDDDSVCGSACCYISSKVTSFHLYVSVGMDILHTQAPNEYDVHLKHFHIYS